MNDDEMERGKHVWHFSNGLHCVSRKIFKIKLADNVKKNVQITTGYLRVKKLIDKKWGVNNLCGRGQSDNT